MSRLRSGFLCFAAAMAAATVLLPRFASAQSVTGTIAGTVTDPQGQVIPGAPVTVIAEATNESRVVVSDTKGDFQATNLQPGMYTLKISLESFRTLERRNIVLSAGERGVWLGVEPLNRFETSFLNLASQAIEVVDRVDHPACGLLLDTFHMNIEERSIGDAIRSAGKRVRHLHTCENDRGAPGSGHVPWQEVAQACRDIGFNGPFVIESFTNKVKSIARAAAIWRKFADTQDALAENGLRHLRALFP